MKRSTPLLPPDRGLPIAGVLLHVDRAEAFVAAILGHRQPVDRLRIRYLAYQPGVALAVQYQVIWSGGAFDAAVTADDRGVHAFRYPYDPALAPLADLPAALASLGLPDGPAERLSWVPGQRAALRCGGTVLKLYASTTEAAGAVRALRHVGGAVPTGSLVAADETRGLVAQARVEGRPLQPADVAVQAQAAGALVRHLHDRVPVDGLPLAGPDELLAQSTAPVALAGFARPALAPRLAAVAERLAATRPGPGHLVATHGDFNLGQLLETRNGLAVIDLDTLSAAAPAFDLAAYATNTVSGRPGDETRAAEALAQVVRGYGDDPGDLGWYVAATLLRRVDRAIRRLKRDWPERTDALVSIVERLSGTLG